MGKRGGGAARGSPVALEPCKGDRRSGRTGNVGVLDRRGEVSLNTGMSGNGGEG